MKLPEIADGALRKFVAATEILLVDLSAEEVGHIADYVGEHGAESRVGEDARAYVDGVVLECLRVIVDHHAGKR